MYHVWGLLTGSLIVIAKIDDFCDFDRFLRGPAKLSDAENDPKSDEATIVILKT